MRNRNMELSTFEKKICLLETVYAYMLFIGIYGGIKILETGLFTIGIAEIFISCVFIGCFYRTFCLSQERFYLK